MRAASPFFLHLARVGRVRVTRSAAQLCAVSRTDFTEEDVVRDLNIRWGWQPSRPACGTFAERCGVSNSLQLATVRPSERSSKNDNTSKRLRLAAGGPLGAAWRAGAQKVGLRDCRLRNCRLRRGRPSNLSRQQGLSYRLHGCRRA